MENEDIHFWINFLGDAEFKIMFIREQLENIREQLENIMKDKTITSVNEILEKKKIIEECIDVSYTKEDENLVQYTCEYYENYKLCEYTEKIYKNSNDKNYISVSREKNVDEIFIKKIHLIDFIKKDAESYFLIRLEGFISDLEEVRFDKKDIKKIVMYNECEKKKILRRSCVYILISNLNNDIKELLNWDKGEFICVKIKDIDNWKIVVEEMNRWKCSINNTFKNILDGGKKYNTLLKKDDVIAIIKNSYLGDDELCDILCKKRKNKI